MDAQQKGPAASTFYLDQTETQFSLSLATDSSDVYIYFASPAYSWVAVGFGETMEDSLMLVMYANARGDSESTPPTFHLHYHLLGTNLHTYILTGMCRHHHKPPPLHRPHRALLLP